MGGWAPLPEEIDLPAYEDWQDREIQRNHNGFVVRLWRWANMRYVDMRRLSVAIVTSLSDLHGRNP